MNIRDYPEIVGTFEWVHSYDASNSSESYETISDKYAILFKKKGDIFIYKNGELIHEGICRGVSENYGSLHVSYYIKTFPDSLGFFTIKDDLLTTKVLPFENAVNDFIKVP